MSVGAGRRPPPPFLLAELAGREWLTPRLVRVTLQGERLTSLEVTQPASSVRVLLPDPVAHPRLPDHSRCAVHWISQEGKIPGVALVDHLEDVEIPDGARLWAAGEAASMQRLRKRLFDDRGIARTHATIRGYWKHGRSGEDQGESL